MDGGATGGLGVSSALGLLVPMEAGVPIPVPSDLVMLLVGERVAAGAIPLWLAVAAFEVVAVVGTLALFALTRGPGHGFVRRMGPRVGLTEQRLARVSAFLERRGRPALAVGRGTPGLRTVTVVAAGSSGLSFGDALPALILGSSFFLQLHLFLGLLLGPLARKALDQARGPFVVAVVALAGASLVFWLVRRRRGAAGGGGGQAWTEAACPACLALALLAERVGSGNPTGGAPRS